jgi:hypothetical protein
MLANLHVPIAQVDVNQSESRMLLELFFISGRYRTAKLDLSMSQMGHSHHFERARGVSVCPLLLRSLPFF